MSFRFPTRATSGKRLFGGSYKIVEYKNTIYFIDKGGYYSPPESLIGLKAVTGKNKKFLTIACRKYVQDIEGIKGKYLNILYIK